MKQLRILNIAPALPPTLDGIGDYSARLCAVLARSAETTILAPFGQTPDAIPGVAIEQVFDPRQRRSVIRLGDAIRRAMPDWVLLQFNQFSYGRWGLNPYLPFVLRAALRDCPKTRLAVMFHEDFVPAINWKFAIMRQWQRWQFKSLGRAADVVMFSIDPWVARYRSWFAGRPVFHLPVGSNIEEIELSSAEARSRLGIAERTIVLGLFGSILPNRNVAWLRAAVDAARRACPDVTLLYVGADVEAARSVCGEVPLIATGTLGADEVSRRIRAMDIYLAPFSDGVSTRRGSMMAGLQHGIATVGTRGEATDSMLDREAGQSLLLTPAADSGAYGDQVAALACDASARRELGVNGAALYRREFDWPAISRRLMGILAQKPETTRACATVPAARHEVAL